MLSNMQTPGHTPSDADSVGLGGASEFTFVLTISGNFETGGPQTTLRNTAGDTGCSAGGVHCLEGFSDQLY